MADRDATAASTDGSSIKPVSSLRSHFENLKAPKLASIAPTSTTERGPRCPDVASNIEHSHRSTGTRHSIDIPQRASTQSYAVVGERGRGTLQSAAIDKRPLTSPQPQPVSIVSSSPKRSPPRVDVTSPKSPPRYVDIPRASPFGQHMPHASAGLSTSSPSSTSHDFRIPSRSRSPQTGLRRSPSAQALSLPELLAQERASSVVDANKGAPSINRGSKPRIPSRERDMTTMSRANEPGPRSTERRVSPFSTPPTSRESTPPPEIPPSIPNHMRPQQPLSMRPPAARFDPPPTHHTVAGKRRETELRKSLDGRPPGLDSLTQPPRRIPGAGDDERPPALPPRRETVAAQPHSHEIPARRSLDLLSRSSALSQGFAASTNAPRLAVLRAPHAASPSYPRDRIAVTASTQPLQGGTRTPPRAVQNGTTRISLDDLDISSAADANAVASSEYPDTSQTNRRPPFLSDGPRVITAGYETRLFDVCGEYVCTTGGTTRVWSLLTGKLLLNINHGEGVKVSSLCFKPARKIEEEGSRLWLGTNWGDILEVDILSRRTMATNSTAHHRREVVQIHRHAAELWSLDDEGKLHIWPADDSGSPNLEYSIFNARIARGHTASAVVGNQLWVACGKDIRVFQPNHKVEDTSIQMTESALSQPGIGDVTSVAIISSQPDCVYFGHSDGKISIYSASSHSCVEIVNVSLYRINILVGVGSYLWAAYFTGMIYVYDTTNTPWTVKKEWHGHEHPVASLVVDRSSIWKLDRLQVLSLGVENTIRVWDGLLKDDWLENDMHKHDGEFCTFRETTALVVTWNAGASKPSDLGHNQRDSNFFRDLFKAKEPPDILVFGLQELVDLEDKRLTAKSFFKSKKSDDSGQEHLSRAYRAWRDHFTGCLEEYMPALEPYVLLHTASLVGLFTCIFVKNNQRSRIRDVQAADVKTGLGGLHGNKGALIVRFLWDDSSLCFVNCHLAAGQNNTLQRNSDIANILETTALPGQQLPSSHSETFIGGGDGSMIFDHEICILSGDLNSRIDTMPRESVTNAIKTRNLDKLLERDQLLMSRRKLPGFRLRAFQEAPITFEPTYKYDVGTDDYDSSEKKRVPAWCDRVLYRGADKIRQVEYQRHEVRVSDHRPVSGRFVFRIKTIKADQRREWLRSSEQRYERAKEQVSFAAK